jgi:hypothetical protein
MFILLCAITHVIHIKLVYMFVSVYKHVMKCQISNVDVVTTTPWRVRLFKYDDRKLDLPASN